MVNTLFFFLIFILIKFPCIYYFFFLFLLKAVINKVTGGVFGGVSKSSNLTVVY